jgi:Zn-finger nucleic acid-binding protein
MEAATLHCPNCGAPASPDARECGYCHARLATVACPHCFATAFVGMRHCPACGAALAREFDPDEAAALACPRCSGALEPVRLGENRLRECAGCGGLWVDNRTFLAICHDHERVAPLLAARPHPGPGTDAGLLRVEYARCPVCRGLMNRLNFARVSGVVVDVCREHGTWFDAGELQRVVEFIERGGIDRGVTRAATDALDELLHGNASAAERDPWRVIFGPFTPSEAA